MSATREPPLTACVQSCVIVRATCLDTGHARAYIREPARNEDLEGVACRCGAGLHTGLCVESVMCVLHVRVLHVRVLHACVACVLRVMCVCVCVMCVFVCVCDVCLRVCDVCVRV